jgi:hypothetical protein
MIFSRPFLLIYFMNMLSIITGFFAVNNFKKYGQKNGLTNENYLAILGSVAAFCNAIRFVWSTATDYYSYKLIYGILLVLQIVIDFTVPLVAHSKGLYAIWVSLMLLTEGGHFVLVPNILKKIYGDKGTQLYGFAFSLNGIASIMIIFMQKYILTTSVESYNKFFFINGSFSAVSLILLLFFFKEDKFKAK